MAKILIVEDDKALSGGIVLALETDSEHFDCAYDIAQATEKIAQEDFELIILDINLPDGSGMELLKKLRAEGGNIPIIMLTANDMETDVVAGFSLGADDYITKPFSLAILRARVEAMLRRGRLEKSTVFEVMGYRFDFEHLEFWSDGKPLDLSKTEQKLLHLLVENKGCTVHRERFFDYVWLDSGEFVDENALPVAMGRLRKKLGKNCPIATVYGLGYSWGDV